MPSTGLRTKLTELAAAKPGKGVRVSSICLVQPPQGMRVFVLVIDTFDQDGQLFAQYCLLSNILEMATDADRTLSRKETGLPFELLGQGDLRGCVEIDRLTVMGAVGEDAVQQVRRYESIEQDSRWGLPLDGPSDPRWQWKLDQLEVIDSISSTACAKLIPEH